MINTRKIAIQSVAMLQVCMQQLVEEEWTDDVVNCGEMEKYCETKVVQQLCQKKSDVLRIKEEIELPGGYPAMQNMLWKSVSLGSLESRPMDGKISLKGELNCYFIYMAQGVNQTVKMLTKKVSFHGLLECSGCQNDMVASVIAMLGNVSVEIKTDFDGEDRVIFLEAALDVMIRVYSEEKIALLKDIYSTSAEIIPEEKVVNAPVIHIAGEGKCKLKQTHRLREGTPKIVQILHTLGNIFPDRAVWENGKLHLMGSVQFQMLYLTGEEEMPYAVTECMVPYVMEMEGSTEGENSMMWEKPMLIVEPRLEQVDSSMVDSQEMELKGIVSFAVLVLNSEKQRCVGAAQCKPLDTGKFADLPSMVMCFAEQDTPLWEFGKRYYMTMEEMKHVNNLNSEILKAGENMLLVKGGKHML